MCSIKRYSKAMLLCSWTNPGFISLTILHLGTFQIDSKNTGPFPMLFLLNEISDSTILDFLYIKEHLKKNSFIQIILDSSNFQLEVQIVIVLSSRGS